MVEVLPAPQNLLVAPVIIKKKEGSVTKKVAPPNKVKRRKKPGMNSSRLNKMKIANNPSCAAAMLCVKSKWQFRTQALAIER